MHPYLTFDAFLSYAFRNPVGRTVLEAGILNVFNRQPPVIYNNGFSFSDPSWYEYSGRRLAPGSRSRDPREKHRIEMFEQLVTKKRLRRRLGAGTTVSFAMHVGIVVTVAWLADRARVAPSTEVEVTLVRRPTPLPPPPPPPPPAAHRSTQPKVKPKPRPTIPKPLVAPQVAPETPPPEEPKEEPPEEEGEEGGVEGGVVGGVVGGVAGGVVGTPPAPATPVRMEFNDTMTPPKMMAGPNLQYTDKAREREVEGLMIVKCVITIEGAVHDCRVLQSLPFMDRAAIEALEKRRYSPALLQGKPVEVDYTFRIRLTLPR